MKAVWTNEQLAALPVRGGMRQRGVEITRLETFCDTEFAFAVTLLVVGGDGIPKSYDELILALKGVPAFGAGEVPFAYEVSGDGGESTGLSRWRVGT